MWLDCRGLGLDHDALVDLFVDKAHLALDDGEMFGSGGEGFMRLNAGTTRRHLLPRPRRTSLSPSAVCRTQLSAWST